jgi:hypothetical protein
MNLDFEKLLKLALPTFLRNGLGNLIKAIAAVFTAIYSDYRAWQTDMRLEAAMTCQNMYIEAMLNYRLLGTFDRIITLEDGTGIPVDFIVKIPDDVQVDSARMVGLVNKYKTYGKRYLIVQGTYTYITGWRKPVCEQVDRTYITGWREHVCEQVDRTYITGWREHVCEQVDRTYITGWREHVCELKELINNYLGIVVVEDSKYYVNADFPVASTLTVSITYWSNDEEYTHDFTIAQGQTNSEIFTPPESNPYQAYITNVSPEYDDTYHYL